MIDLMILVFVSLLFGVLFWRRPALGLAIFLLVLPFYRIKFLIFNVPFTLIEALILVAFFLFITKKLLSKQRLTYSNYKWLILLLLIIVSLAIFYSPDKRAALGVWKAYFIEPIMFFIIFINIIKTRNDWQLILKFLGLSILGISALAIYQKFTGAFIPNEFWAVAQTRRVTSVYGYPNAIGLYLAPLILLFLGQAYLLWEKSVGKYWTQIIYYLIVAISGSLAILFAQSEGAIVALGIGGLLFGLLIKKLRIITLIFLFLAMVGVFAFPTIGSLVQEKALFQDFSGNLRLVMWQETIQMLKVSPIWGGGISGYQTAIAPFHHAKGVVEIYLYPHNFILNFWTEIGILGLLIVGFLILKYLINYWKVKNSDNRSLYILLICCLMVIITHGIVDVPYFKNDLSVLWWLFFGISVMIIKSKKEILEFDKG